MATSRRAWVSCAAVGLAVLVTALLLMPLFPKDVASDLRGYGEPIFAFEFARDASDLVAVFGHVDDPKRPERIASMDRGNRWDYAFMPLYAAFIFSFFWAAFRQTARRRWLVFGALGLLAGAADAVENTILLGLTSDLEAANHLGLLAYPVTLKFLAIAIAGVAAGAYLASLRHRLWTALGLVTAAAMLSVLLALWDGSRFGWLAGNGIAVGWTVQLVYAAWASTRRPPTWPRSPLARVSVDHFVIR